MAAFKVTTEGIGEGADQLRHGRGRRQHRFVLQPLGFRLTDLVQDVLGDAHGVIPGTFEYRLSSVSTPLLDI
jgi:hypothetical protein